MGTLNNWCSKTKQNRDFSKRDTELQGINMFTHLRHLESIRSKKARWSSLPFREWLLM